jgi:hypothetical protein
MALSLAVWETQAEQAWVPFPRLRRAGDDKQR